MKNTKRTFFLKEPSDLSFVTSFTQDFSLFFLPIVEYFFHKLTRENVSAEM